MSRIVILQRGSENSDPIFDIVSVLLNNLITAIEVLLVGVLDIVVFFTDWIFILIAENPMGFIILVLILSFFYVLIKSIFSGSELSSKVETSTWDSDFEKALSNTNMTSCPNCFKIQPDNTIFCYYCGRNLIDSEAVNMEW